MFRMYYYILSTNHWKHYWKPLLDMFRMYYYILSTNHWKHYWKPLLHMFRMYYYILSTNHWKHYWISLLDMSLNITEILSTKHAQHYWKSLLDMFCMYYLSICNNLQHVHWDKINYPYYSIYVSFLIILSIIIIIGQLFSVPDWILTHSFITSSSTIFILLYY